MRSIEGSKYFNDKEFVCKCGCGMININIDFYRKLVKARIFSGIKYVVRSGCRCLDHNTQENGHENSRHIASDEIECKAIDIEYNNSFELARILRGVIYAGFNSVGISGDFVHAADSINEKYWRY